jgi:hypothetical protein
MRNATATLFNPDGSKVHLDQVDDAAGELTGIRLALESPDGDLTEMVLPLHAATYVAGWLAMSAGVDVARLAAGAVDAAEQNAAAAEDARGRYGAH